MSGSEDRPGDGGERTAPTRLDGIAAVRAWRRTVPSGAAVGFVPTMGALHEGHLALIRAARAENDLVAASVYVNPIQFGPGEDFEAYPRDLEADRLRIGAAADVLAAFSDAEMYPGGFSTFVDVEGVTEGLCGAARPGHFRGVTTVVAKLFHIVRPHRAYFGRKDAQQAAAIRRMTRDLDFDIEIRTVETVREPGGLAMSSRNAYLTPAQRERGLCLFRALAAARDAARAGETDPRALQEILRRTVREIGGGEAALEYAEIVDPESFRPVTRVGERALAALAVRIGPARLIDNMELP